MELNQWKIHETWKNTYAITPLRIELKKAETASNLFLL